jgi:hypothetical protein
MTFNQAFNQQQTFSFQRGSQGFLRNQLEMIFSSMVRYFCVVLQLGLIQYLFSKTELLLGIVPKANEMFLL